MADDKKVLGMGAKVSWLSVTTFIILAIFIGFVLWSSFVKRTSITKLGQGAVQNIYNDVPKVPLMGVGCTNLKAELYWQRARQAQ